MTDPEKNFLRWWDEHYDSGDAKVTRSDDGRFIVLARCRRCGEAVGWATRHAVERHGDPIDVIAPAEDTEPEVLAAY